MVKNSVIIKYNKENNVYHLYSVHKLSDDWDEIPAEKREWWILAHSDSCKEALIQWHSKYKRDYAYKIISSDRSLKDIFYPRAEIKTRTQTAQMLKTLKYGT
jgi:hypothetical protein